MKTIMKFFLVLSEESKTTDEVRVVADQLFHNECRVQTEGRVLNKPRIMADMDELVKKKVTMELQKIEQDEFGINYEYSVRQPREKGRKMAARAMIRDGKIYHLEIVDAVSTAPAQSHPHPRRATAPVIHGF